MALFPQGLSNIDQRCNAGERRVLHQLKRCLEDDYLVWHNVPVGTKGLYPDFVILHPGRGLLVLEVKGWRAGAIREASRHDVLLDVPSGRVSRVEVRPLRGAGAPRRVVCTRQPLQKGGRW